MCGAENGPIAAVGNDEETTSRRIAELLDLLARRRAMREAGGLTWPPVLVVLDGARRIRLLPGLVTLLRDGPSLGVLFLCIDDEERHLPEECRAVVTIAETTTVAIAGDRPVDAIRTDLVDRAWFERLGPGPGAGSRRQPEDLASALPTSSRLLEVLRLDPPRAADVVATGGCVAGARRGR